MAVRNFWVTGGTDVGKEHSFGPMAKEDGIHITVKIRNKGSSIEALTIHGSADKEGNLTLVVYPDQQYLSKVIYENGRIELKGRR